MGNCTRSMCPCPNCVARRENTAAYDKGRREGWEAAIRAARAKTFWQQGDEHPATHKGNEMRRRIRAHIDALQQPPERGEGE